MQLLMYQSVASVIEGYDLRIPKRTKSRAGEFDGIALDVGQYQRVGLGVVVDETPDLGIDPEWLELEAMIRVPVAAKKFAVCCVVLPRERRSTRPFDPATSFVYEP